jgi:hypothetical protein
MTVGKTPLKSGPDNCLELLLNSKWKFRFNADGGNFQIIQGISSNLHEEGISCRLREPIPASASYAYLSVVTEQKQCDVSGRILATQNDARTSLSSDRRTLNRR